MKAICTIITADWVDRHLVRWLRYAKQNCPDWSRYLYFCGPGAVEHPWLREEFAGIIELPESDRPMFNRVRMGACADFGVDAIVYCDADADIIGNIDELYELGKGKKVGFVESPALHGSWREICDKKKWINWEANNGLLYMSCDLRSEYDKAVEDAKEHNPPARIAGTIAFNLMLRSLEDGQYVKLPENYSVIWWDHTSFLGAKIVQYCNDKGQDKRIRLESIYRNSLP